MNVLILTDERNLPTSNSYYGTIHNLVQQYYSDNKEFYDYNLLFDTPLNALGYINDINAIIDRTLVYSDTIKQFHTQALSLVIPYLNNPNIMQLFASKWKSYTLLQNTTILQPTTEQLKDSNQITEFLKRYKCIVVKPEWGGMGTDVCFIKQTDPNKIIALWKEKRGDIVDTFKFEGSPQQFYSEYIESKKPDKSGDTRSSDSQNVQWIIQEQVDIRDQDGYAFDIRILQQRDDSNVLKTALTHGRKSSCQEIPLTNIDKGGEIEFDINTKLQKMGFSDIDIIDFCNKVNQIIEAQYGPIGEVGHDVAVIKKDGKNELCYIEGNSMPGYIFKEWEVIKNKPDYRLLSPNEQNLISNPLKYCKYLLRH